MKKIIISSLLALSFLGLMSFGVNQADAYVSVKGYTKKNGTYVAPYVRSNPNGLKYDNYGYKPSQGLYNKTYGTKGSTWDTPTYITDPNYYTGKNLYNLGSSSYYDNPTPSIYSTTPSCPLNSYYDGISSCKCNSGYVASGSSCVYVSKYSPEPSATCPLNSSTSLTDSTKCSCDAGYQVNITKDACVIAPVKTQAELCNDSFGINSIPTSDGKCICNSGYEWATDNKSCILSPVKTNEQICQDSFGLNAIWDGTYSATSGELNCNCKTGFIWDTFKKNSCVSNVDISKKLFFSTLKYGSRGNEVKSLQEKLIKKGYLKGNPDGIFKTMTNNAVRIFQADNGLTADGVVGLKTMEFLSK